MRFLFNIFVFLFLMTPLHAAELFGVNLKNASRDTLRNAVKQAGVELISEAGDDALFDVYSSQSLMHGSRHLYLGFVKKNNEFAFAEYEFVGLKHPELLVKLENKYGKARIKNGKFFSDKSFTWLSNGTLISLQTDWSTYTTRLLYENTLNLKQLRLEAASLLDKSKQQQKAFAEQAF